MCFLEIEVVDLHVKEAIFSANLERESVIPYTTFANILLNHNNNSLDHTQ